MMLGSCSKIMIPRTWGKGSIVWCKRIRGFIVWCKRTRIRRSMGREFSTRYWRTYAKVRRRFTMLGLRSFSHWPDHLQFREQSSYSRRFRSVTDCIRIDSRFFSGLSRSTRSWSCRERSGLLKCRSRRGRQRRLLEHWLWFHIRSKRRCNRRRLWALVLSRVRGCSVRALVLSRVRGCSMQLRCKLTDVT